jgi:hypothetical protein
MLETLYRLRVQLIVSVIQHEINKIQSMAAHRMRVARIEHYLCSERGRNQSWYWFETPQGELWMDPNHTLYGNALADDRG